MTVVYLRVGILISPHNGWNNPNRPDLVALFKESHWTVCPFLWHCTIQLTGTWGRD
ncbi:protein of unknown function [Candidatus Filomicrobium marinum]|nr:protein of unknown function [Candidatus Filomicrobium marinum]